MKKHNTHVTVNSFVVQTFSWISRMYQVTKEEINEYLSSNTYMTIEWYP